MNPLTPIYFPGTDIHSLYQYPIFLLFQKIHLIKPVEDYPVLSGVEPPDSFMKSGFCQVHTPCPLAGDRTRFLHLVDSIRIGGAEYITQLKALSLAAINNYTSPSEDSAITIAHSLTDPKALQEASRQDAREETLWQARLVLVMAEILDRDQEKILSNLLLIEDKRQKLFEDLHGDTEPHPRNNFIQTGGGMGEHIKKRFQAWKALFIESDIQEKEIFLASSKETGDLLLSLYEKKTDLPAPYITGLELPNLIGWDTAEAIEAIRTFSYKNKTLLGQVHQILARLSHKKALKGDDLQGQFNLEVPIKKWRAQLETTFPTRRFGRTKVRIYIFPGIGCPELIDKATVRSDKPINGLLITAS